MSKKFFQKDWIILILILTIATIIRFWKLGLIPPSIHWDETALGYNAYSILATGKDEYGNLLPLIFKSFGDFKPGVYVYLTVPSVAIFGLTEFAVRFPGAFFGVLGVLAIYLLTLEFFPKRNVAQAAAFSMAVSPWHILLSRPAFEASVSATLTLFAILFFIKAIKLEKTRFLLLSTFLFAATFYTYQVAKFSTPLILVGLILFYYKKLFKSFSKQLVISGLILIFAIIPIFYGVFFGGQAGRAVVKSVFSYPRPAKVTAEILNQDSLTQPNFLFEFFHGQWFDFTKGVLRRYLHHFGPDFLFKEGDVGNQRHIVPGMGMFYYLDLLFLISGFLALARIRSAVTPFLIFWLLTAPIPASLTRDEVQAVRSLLLLPPLQILIGLGLVYTIELFRNFKRFFVLFFAILGLVYLWNVGNFLDRYFVHLPKKFSQYWLYGHKQVISQISSTAGNFDNLIITSDYGQPYIYFLFYTKYHPAVYQKEANLIPNPTGDVGYVPGFGPYQFRHIYWPEDRGLKNSLFVGTQWELPDEDLKRDINLGIAKLRSEIKFLDGQPAFRIVETK